MTSVSTEEGERKLEIAKTVLKALLWALAATVVSILGLSFVREAWPTQEQLFWNGGEMFLVAFVVLLGAFYQEKSGS